MFLMMPSTKIANGFLLKKGAAIPLDKKSPPEPLVQIQNNFTKMFLQMPSTKIDQNVQFGWTTWLPELKKEISLNHISLATGQYIIYSCARIHVSDQEPSCIENNYF